MSIQKQVVPIAFAGGIDTQTDPKQVPTARLLDLQNGVFEKNTTIVKRNGYRALGRNIDGSGMQLPTGKAFASRGDELLYLSADNAYSYRPSSDTWVDTGAVLSVVASMTGVAETGTEQTSPDHATSRGVTLLAWEDGFGGTGPPAQGVWWALLEADTGAVLRPPEQAGAGQRPRCLAVGDRLHLVWADSMAGSLQIIVVNPTVPLAPAVATSLTTDLDPANPAFDAEPTDRTGTPAIVAWARAGLGWRIGYIDASGVLGSALTGHPPVATYAEAITGPIATAYGTTGAQLAVMTSEGGGAALFANLIAPADLTSRSAQVTVFATIPVVRVTACWARDAASAASSARVCYWAAEVSGARLDLNTVASGLFVDAGVAGPTATELRGHGLVTRAFRDDAAVYVGLAHDVAFFSYVAVARLSTPIPADAVTASTFPIWTPLDLPLAARLLPIRAYGLTTRGHLSSVVTDVNDTRVHRMALSAQEQLNTTPDPGFTPRFTETGIRLTSLDFDHDDAWQSAELGAGLYLAGACPMQYDGSRWAEMGAHTAPDTGIVITPTATGQLTGDSVYLYRFVYEAEDAQGEWHRFATSLGTLVTTLPGAIGVVGTTMNIPTLRLTRRGRVRIGVFRSLANGTANLWRVSTVIPNPLFQSYVLNDPTVDFVTMTDGLADAFLVTFEPLYTNGGIVSNDPPPWAGNVLAGGKNRLFWTDPQDPQRVRFSQERAETFGVETPESLSFVCDPLGGPITALAVMDDALIVFKRDAVFVVGGPGPLANPLIDTQSFSFSPPALIPSDVGCSRASSIGITPVGILFQSAKGPMALTRSRSVERIGDDVDAFQDVPIVASTLLPDRTQIVMLTSGDRTLLYDYRHQQWSTFSNHAGVDAIVVGGAYYYLRTDGRIFVETPGAYLDDNTQIQRVIETAWIHVAPYLQGWHVFWWAYVIGTYRSPHTLVVQVQTDYESNWGPPLELNVNADFDPALYGGGAYGDGPYGGPPTQSTRYQKRIHIGKRGQAVRFRFYDLEATGDAGAAFDLSELVLEGGVTRQTAMIGAPRSG